MKVIAFHLPQYHEIPENDEWWGKGFTEWVNVKDGKVYHEGQYQPREPLNENYYNLLDINTLKWQAALARKYGIYGFCFYHYWFNGHMLLEKPVELFKSLGAHEKIPYCICWANENWTKAWADKTNEILIEQKYGNHEEWIDHFNYLLQFFMDPMYIKENNKPLLVIYRPELIYNLKKMLLCWEEMAKKNGFDGISFSYQQYSYLVNHGKEEKLFSHNIEYQPAYTIAKKRIECMNFKDKIYYYAPNFVRNVYTQLKSNMKGNHPKDLLKTMKTGSVYDYDEIWSRIITSQPTTPKSIPGAFIDFDNTPRRKENGTYFRNVTVEKFKSYFKKQLIHARNDYSSDYLFFFAWNEWGECAYLEPDKLRRYSVLEAIYDSLVETKELEQ